MKRKKTFWFAIVSYVLVATVLVVLGERISKLQVEVAEVRQKLTECQDTYRELKDAADAVLRKCVDADACVESCVCIHPEESMKIEDILWGEP